MTPENTGLPYPRRRTKQASTVVTQNRQICATVMWDGDFLGDGEETGSQGLKDAVSRIEVCCAAGVVLDELWSTVVRRDSVNGRA